MTDMINRGGLSVATPLATFVEHKALPGTGVTPERFWSGLADIFAKFAPENRALLAERDRMQASIDRWHEERRGRPIDPQAYQAFLRELGYLVAEPPAFRIESKNVDGEVASMAGPQLVVPSLNDRFVLNAANARWGSLYDAFYGTDALPGKVTAGGYDGGRGAQVIERAKAFLDETLPLATGSHSAVKGYSVVNGTLVASTQRSCSICRFSRRCRRAKRTVVPSSRTGHRARDRSQACSRTR